MNNKADKSINEMVCEFCKGIEDMPDRIKTFLVRNLMIAYRKGYLDGIEAGKDKNET